MIEFTVFGRPRPAGSKRAFMRPGMKHPVITETNPHTPAWRSLVTDAARAAYQGPILEGPVKLTIEFFFLRPKAHFGSKKGTPYLRSDAPRYVTKAPDVVKLARSTEDSLKGIVWRDDAQVAVEELCKQFGDWQGARVRIEALSNNFMPEIP